MIRDSWLVSENWGETGGVGGIFTVTEETSTKEAFSGHGDVSGLDDKVFTHNGEIRASVKKSRYFNTSNISKKVS